MQITDDYLNDCITVICQPGQRVKVQLNETDGFFIIDFDYETIRVLADIPDSSGRGGIDKDGVANLIYEDNMYACPGCGCAPGDGASESCHDPDGCGWGKDSR